MHDRSMYRSLFGDFDFMEMFLGCDVFARHCKLTLVSPVALQQPNYWTRFFHYLDFGWTGGFVQHVRTQTQTLLSAVVAN